MKTVDLLTLVRRFVTHFSLGVPFLGSGQDLVDFG